MKYVQFNLLFLILNLLTSGIFVVSDRNVSLLFSALFVLISAISKKASISGFGITNAHNFLK